MRLLLDTHVLLWWLTDDVALSTEHRELIGDPRNTILVSAVTVAEVGIKASLGKLDVPDDSITDDISSVIESSGFDELPLTSVHADELRRLPWHHRDQFDRMLICQARVERIPFLTMDPRCREYEVEIR